MSDLTQIKIILIYMRLLISISNRNIVSGPGPARYQLPTGVGVKGHDPRKVRAPAYSLAASLDRNRGNKVPGPNHYKVNIVYTRKGKDGTPQYSLAARYKNINLLPRCREGFVNRFLFE